MNGAWEDGLTTPMALGFKLLIFSKNWKKKTRIRVWGRSSGEDWGSHYLKDLSRVYFVLDWPS